GQMIAADGMLRYVATSATRVSSMSKRSQTTKNGMNAATGGMKRSDSTKKRRSFLARKSNLAKMYAAGTASRNPMSRAAGTTTRLFLTPVTIVPMLSTRSKFASVGVNRSLGG